MSYYIMESENKLSFFGSIVELTANLFSNDEFDKIKIERVYKIAETKSFKVFANKQDNELVSHIDSDEVKDLASSQIITLYVVAQTSGGFYEVIGKVYSWYRKCES